METEKQEISSVTATDGEKKPRGRGLYEDKAGRVVLRNLQFDIKEKHLKQNFAKFGKIIDASVPLNPENSLNKGFGFIEFSTRDEARKAIQEMNGKPYKGRTIAIDFALSKRQYNRKIDEIIQKNPIKKKEKKEEEQKEEAPKPKQDSDSSDWNSEPEEEKPQEIKTTKKQEFKEKFKAQGEQKEKKERQRSMKKYVNDAEEGLTLFVRNIDYSTTEAELKEFFEEHGEVYFARLVKSKDNPDVHKGFAFVKFKNKEVVEKLAELWGPQLFKKYNYRVNIGEMKSLNFRMQR